MKAAIVEKFGELPHYGEFDVPQPGDGQQRVWVKAAALSQLVRAQAAGRHYSSAQPPLVPGADGVGVLDNGQRVYFAFPAPPFGSMAEQVVVDSGNIVALPDHLDDITAAAMANPAMSSWAALVERLNFQPGQRVLVNGANGASGRLAVQIARHLGAAHIVATARSRSAESELKALGADTFISLEHPHDELSAAFQAVLAEGMDAVLDYVWGPSIEALLAALPKARGRAAAPPVRIVNMGSLAGEQITLKASMLRSADLQMMGSGLGSVSQAGLLRSIAAAFAAAETAGLKIATQVFPLAEVAQAWRITGRERVVLRP
ncbi:quinone oxidoreductase family protein [Spongiibacter tropicus]|uniref:quinone oxidoreductase family protein n=1 Tax=Spongiibacter tropicus TaxID=454602 RepID=UPI003A99C730